MNREKYNDPTAETAIANVMRERRKVKRHEYKYSNESLLPGSGQEPEAVHCHERKCRIRKIC
jgi:hypothetical protein